MIQVFIKDLKVFLTDRRSILLTFLLPIALISLFALAFGSLGKTKDSNPIDLLLADSDHSLASGSIVKALEDAKGIQILKVEEEEGILAVSKGSYSGVLVLHEGLQDSLVKAAPLPLEFIFDQAREVEVGLIQPILIGALLSLKEATVPDNQQTSGIKMTSVIGADKGANLGIIQAVAGTAILMLLFSVARLGAGILDEKEGGTLNRLLASPIGPNAILLGKMSLTFFVAVVQLWVMFLFAWLVFGLDLWIDVPALVLMILSTAFAVASFGIFLAAISRTYQQSQSLSTLLILTMSAAGGSMIPLFIMPAFMRKLAVFTVNYWGMEGFFDIFWRDLPLREILPEIGVLLVIGLVMSSISFLLFRRNVIKLI